MEQTQKNRQASDARRVLVTYCRGDQGSEQGHERRTLAVLAKRLAQLLGYEYAGAFDAKCDYGRPLYFVPIDTLTAAEGQALGIAHEEDLFGGVVPYAFVAGKTITHPLPLPECVAPQGWSPRFAAMSQDVVLPGYSAFSIQDASYAARNMLERGTVRVKKAGGVGGAGQSVVSTAAELEAVLSGYGAEEVLQEGVVVERNLHDVVTCSVGRVRAGPMVLTYCGTQCTTTNNVGNEVYGGSELFVVRGDFGLLLQQSLPDHQRIAIEQAGKYHRAAWASFPGLLATRCNYDIAQGFDDEGVWHSGVLEQSWRVGGASAAELCALAAFQSEPDLIAVRAWTREVYGKDAVVPQGAEAHFQGVDHRVGPLIKYSWAQPG